MADEVLPYWAAGRRPDGAAGDDDLGALLRRRGRLSAGRAAVLVSQLAEALDSAHDAGMIHGRVTPASILISPGEPGRAVLTGAGAGRPGGSGGTLDYLAPEQIEGAAAGPRADQYALACVAYETLSGEPPFRRGDDLSLLRGQFADTPLPLTSLRPDLPPEADHVLARAMARDQGDRYHRCLDFAAALTSACGLDLDLVEPHPPVPAARPAPAAATMTSGPVALRAIPQLAQVPQLAYVPPPAQEQELAAAPVPRPAEMTGPGPAAEAPQPGGPADHGRPPWRADGPGAIDHRPGRPERRSPVLATAVLVVLLAIAGGIVMIVRSGGFSGGGPARSPGAASPGQQVSSPAGQPSASPSPSPSPPRAEPRTAPRGPAGVVRAYFTAINRHDYRRAWRLGGHVSSATYGEFATGLGTTSRDTLVVLSVNEDTVTARLIAVQTDGSVKTYQGTYVVSDGVIAQASVRQID